MIRFSPIASAADDNKEEAVFFVKRADVGISPFNIHKLPLCHSEGLARRIFALQTL